MTAAPADSDPDHIGRLARRLSGLAFAAGVVILLAGAFARSGPAITAAAGLIGIGAAANAAAWGARTSKLWRTGGWTSLGGVRRSREHQPRRFAGVLVIHILASAAWLMGAGALLAWIVMAHLPGAAERTHPAPPPVQSVGEASR